MTSRRVKLANNVKALKGKTHGLKPYGFMRDKDNNYTLKDDEADIVKEMYKMSLSGIGAYQIADILNERGVPTKFNQFKGQIRRKNADTGKIEYSDKSNVKWRGNVVHDILKNPMNKGERYWKGELVAKLDVQIVDEELWQKVNDNFAKNKRDKSGRRAKYNYLLNGIFNLFPLWE